MKILPVLSDIPGYSHLEKVYNALNVRKHLRRRAKRAHRAKISAARAKWYEEVVKPLRLLPEGHVQQPKESVESYIYTIHTLEGDSLGCGRTWAVFSSWDKVMDHLGVAGEYGDFYHECLYSLLVVEAFPLDRGYAHCTNERYWFKFVPCEEPGRTSHGKFLPCEEPEYYRLVVNFAMG